MAVADTYDSTKTISEQQSTREAAVVAEDAYYKSAGKIERPLPDNWPWPEIEARMDKDDVEDAALTQRVTTAEGKITTNTQNIATNTGNISSHGTRLTTAEGKITTAEGEIDTLQSDVSSLDSRVDALESPAAG